MTGEVSQSQDGEQVVLDFMYERFAFSPGEAERVGVELIKHAARAADERDNQE